MIKTTPQFWFVCTYSTFFLIIGFVIGRTLAPESKSRSPEPLLFKALAPSAETVEISQAPTSIPTEGELKRQVLQSKESLVNDLGLEQLVENLRAWAAANPVEAIAYIKENLRKGSQYDMAMHAVLTEWATTDPHAAWEWATKTSYEDGRHLNAVLFQIGKDDPEAAWDFATKFAADDPKDGRDAYGLALQGIIHGGDYQTAAALIESIDNLPQNDEDGYSEKYELAAAFVGSWAMYDPIEAAKWTKSLPQDSITYDRAIINLGLGWSETDPEGAADYAASLSGKASNRMISAVFPHLIENEPEQAHQWLAKFEGNPAMDSARDTLAIQSYFNDGEPDRALKVANSIVEPYSRFASLHTLTSDWIEEAPEDAIDYIRNSPDLTEETRAGLLKSLTNSGLITQ